MTHSNMLEATTCEGAVRHQCAALTVDCGGSIIKHSHPRDNDYAYVWDSPHRQTAYCGTTDMETKIVPINTDSQDINMANIHVSANMENVEKEHNMICDTFPKDNLRNGDEVKTTSSFKPSQKLTSTFHGSGVHFDPDVVPLATTPAAKS